MVDVEAIVYDVDLGLEVLVIIECNELFRDGIQCPLDLLQSDNNVSSSDDAP